ncbi:MAG: putative sulfate exporter family transporter [Rhodoferax sp.]
MTALAMVLYPLLASAIGLSPGQSSIFFGATIHDVAQVVAAGMMLSDAGNTAAAVSATVVKLFRIMLLMPVALLLSLTLRNRNKGGADCATDEKPAPALLLVP